MSAQGQAESIVVVAMIQLHMNWEMKASGIESSGSSFTVLLIVGYPHPKGCF